MGLATYQGDRVNISLVADRSQWFVDVQPATDAPVAPGSPGWFGLEEWSRCLGSPVLFHDARPTPTDEDWLEVIANSWWLEPQLN